MPMRDQPLTPVPCARRTEPTRHLWDGATYVPWESTDIRKTFERVRAEAPKGNVKKLRTAR